MVTALDEAEEALSRYRYFEECLLEEVRWREAGRVAELKFGYIWEEDPGGHGVLNQPRPVIVRLVDALSLSIDSPLTSFMLENSDRLDWGVTEIAQLRMARPSELLPRVRGMEHALQVVAEWELQGRIDILFRNLVIDDPVRAGRTPLS